MRTHRLAGVLTSLVVLAHAGCALGPRGLEATRLRYNEALKVTSEEQLLLNIVRLRYGETPSSLAVSTIAAQFELSHNAKLIPLFGVSGDFNPRGRGTVLPQLELLAADRPTISMTPQDDAEFTRKLFTPITLDGVTYLARTTWPISTVFRLYLENLNWVSNAQTASGPTPKQPPEFAEFLRGILALQVLQDRNQVALVVEERTEKMGGPLPAARITAAAIAEAAKNGHEYRKDEGGATWTLVKKKEQPVLRFHPHALASAEYREFVEVFRLKPGRASYDVETGKLDPFPVNYPAEGVEVLDLETRSLLHVLYFIAHGILVPPEHVAKGIVPVTAGPDGELFDWQQVTRGLFTVHSACGKKPPPEAAVAVRYGGYWFYIDRTDQDTKATFSLVLELSRLDVTAKGASPLLTIPVGGR